MTHQVETTFYAIVEPTYGTVWRNGKAQDGVSKIRVAQVLQKKPAKMKSGVAVKLTLRFNEAAFMPLAPSAIIDIPDSLVAMGASVEVEAEDEDSQAVQQYLAARARGEVT